MIGKELQIDQLATSCQDSVTTLPLFVSSLLHIVQHYRVKCSNFEHQYCSNLGHQETAIQGAYQCLAVLHIPQSGAAVFYRAIQRAQQCYILVQPDFKSAILDTKKLPYRLYIIESTPETIQRADDFCLVLYGIEQYYVVLHMLQFGLRLCRIQQ